MLAVAALVPLAACDVGTKAPAPQAQPPCRGSSGVGGPVPAGLGPGDLVSSEELTAANQESPGFPTDARVWRVLYVSTSADETDLQLVCGTVALPESGPRTIGSGSGDGGRLLAWSHGTIGLEQRCLPSSDPATHFWGPMPGGIQAVAWGSLLGKHQGRPEDGALQYAMDNGWAVVATDYQPDDTYILGRVAAANVLDSARAATQLGQEVFGPDTPDRYDMITWGHSQGGHAALWAGQLAETYLEGTEPSRPTPTIELAGVAALAPAGNFVAEPGDQPGVAYGDGLADWEMHEGIPELLNLPIPALELQIGPALFSFIFGSWNQFAQGNRPSPDAEFPASPPNTPEPVLEDIATPTGIETINTVMPQCLAGADAKVIGEATSQYRNAEAHQMLVPALWNLPADYSEGEYFKGGADRTCATSDDAGLQVWCDWIRFNQPGPLGDNPFPKVPEVDGRPVPLLMAQGTDDEVIHCVTPDGTDPTDVPPPSDCMSRAMFDSFRSAAYCPDGEAEGHLQLDLARPQALTSPASHFSIPGEISARSLGRSSGDLSFEGSRMQRFMVGAFDGTLEPGCTAEVVNP